MKNTNRLWLIQTNRASTHWGKTYDLAARVSSSVVMMTLIINQLNQKRTEQRSGIRCVWLSFFQARWIFDYYRRPRNGTRFATRWMVLPAGRACPDEKDNLTQLCKHTHTNTQEHEQNVYLHSSTANRLPTTTPVEKSPTRFVSSLTRRTGLSLSLPICRWRDLSSRIGDFFSFNEYYKNYYGMTTFFDRTSQFI
jgi:hypothetical protein